MAMSYIFNSIVIFEEEQIEIATSNDARVYISDALLHCEDVKMHFIYKQTANSVGWYAHNRKTTKDIWLGRGACPSIVADNLQILNEELWNKILYKEPEIIEGGNING